MRTTARSALAAAAILPSVLAAQSQNFVRNGDFEASTIAPWTMTGYALNPGLQRTDVDGTGNSQCYAATPGRQTNSGSFPTHRLEQTVTLAPVPYELGFDLAQTGQTISFSPQPPSLTVFVGGQQVTSAAFPANRLRRSILRMRVCARFKPTSAGSHTLSLQMFFQGNAVGNGFRFHVDNVVLRLARDPMFCIAGDRILGQQVRFEVTGAPSAGFLVWLSTGLLPQPIKVPGIQGEFALGLQLLIPFLSGALDTAGGFNTTLPIPAIPALSGRRLFWQGLQVQASGASFGWNVMQAFYN